MLMKKKLIIFCLMLIPSTGFAISVVGGQGYGSFRLSGAGSTSLASVMSVGVRFNKYIELKYLSMDTSFRMPLLPLRLADINYSSHILPNGDTSYIYYDSDVLGVSLSLPFTEKIGMSAMYGYGRAKIYNFTKVLTPAIGTMIHFLDSKSGYSNAMSWYLTVSVSYVFNKSEDKK